MTLAKQFDDLWRTSGTVPDLDGFLSANPSLGLSAIAEICLLDQYHRWRIGDPQDLNAYLELRPFCDDQALRIDLLIEEFGYREERGHEIEVEEFVGQFPADRELLIQQLGNSSHGAAADHCEFPEIERYELIEELGRGAFGAVFLATDLELQRKVAIKVPYQSKLTDHQLERFRKEAQIVAAMDHRSIVPVYDARTTASGQQYVVSKFIDGKPLDRTSIDSNVNAVKLVKEVCHAMQHAHQKGIIHRDLKPANILIDAQQRPFVVDFGLFKIDADLRDQANWVGTPAYMSPEQARGESHRVDARSDLFSLGIILYELVTGQKPWRSSSTSEILKEIQRDEYRSPRQIADVDRELERIIVKAMSNRLSQRYSTASDMAEDLGNWLQQREVTTTVAIEVSEAKEIPSAVARGLRSYSEEDSSFFLQMLPGPFARNGLPDHVSFWLNRINARSDDSTFSVGLVYGPSGCGKSSLIKAAVIPNLSEDVQTVYLEAAANNQTDRNLRQLLNTRFPQLRQQSSLKNCINQFRIDRHIGGGDKLLIVIDQFEQWLDGWDGDANDELILALRQCDGKSVQSLVMVRDDFWMATTRFMKCLEIPLVQFVNCAGVDLFDRRHAKKVLAILGQSYGAFQESLSCDDVKFLDEAVDAVAIDDKIIPVRLSLFAEMIKKRPWRSETLDYLGGIEGVGVAFLEESFGPLSPPQNKLHADGARLLLEELLPESGSNIRGASKTRADLQIACVAKKDDTNFEDLVAVLDKDLRLITPVDDQFASQGFGSSYQLTHDYLVPAIRTWLNQNQRLSAGGRVRLNLKERAADWSQKPENRRLPSSLEYALTQLFTSRRQWTENQKSMMAAATKFHLQRLVIFLGLALALSFLVFELVGRFKAHSLVDQLLAARSDEVDSSIEQLRAFGRWGYPILRDRERGQLSKAQKLYVDLALAKKEPARQQNVLASLPDAEPDTFELLIRQLEDEKEALVGKLSTTFGASGLSNQQKLNIAGAIARWEPHDSFWESHGSSVASLLLDSSVTKIGIHVNRLKGVESALVPRLQVAFSSGSEQRRKTASVLLAEFDISDEEFVELLLSSNKSQLPAFIESTQRKNDSLLAEFILDAFEEQMLKQPDEIAGRAGQIANLMVGMFSQGNSDVLLAAFADSSNQLLRYHAIERLGECEFDPLEVLDLLDGDESVPRTVAIVQCVGLMAKNGVADSAKETLVFRLADLYRNHGDCGVHASCRWALKRLGAWKLIDEIDEDFSKKPIVRGNWRHEIDGNIYFQMPADVTWYPSHLQEDGDEAIGRISEVFEGPKSNQRVCICLNEVTNRDFREFADGKEGFQEPDQRFWQPLITSPLDGPAIEVSWFAAVEYCNWMSRKHGIPESQWCYRPNEQGLYAGGMVIPQDILQRTGFRLPTLAEIRTAVAAGNNDDAWFFGNDFELADGFAWHVFNSERTAHQCGELRPNDWGLFDAVGNVSEWCMTPMGLARFVDPTKQGDLVIRGDMKMYCTGGTYLLHEFFLRTKSKQSRFPHVNEHATGFRLTRTINE